MPIIRPWIGQREAYMLLRELAEARLEIIRLKDEIEAERDRVWQDMRQLVDETDR